MNGSTPGIRSAARVRGSARAGRRGSSPWCRCSRRPTLHGSRRGRAARRGSRSARSRDGSSDRRRRCSSVTPGVHRRQRRLDRQQRCRRAEHRVGDGERRLAGELLRDRLIDARVVVDAVAGADDGAGLRPPRDADARREPGAERLHDRVGQRAGERTGPAGDHRHGGGEAGRGIERDESIRRLGQRREIFVAQARVDGQLVGGAPVVLDEQIRTSAIGTARARDRTARVACCGSPSRKSAKSLPVYRPVKT